MPTNSTLVYSLGKPNAAVFLMVSCMFFGLLFTNNVNGDTTPYSTISSDTTWTQAGSPYSLSGPVLVQPGVTLTIEAGAIVNLHAYYLQVNGTLTARGTSTNPIHIVSDENNAGVINFAPSSPSWDEGSGVGCIIEKTILDHTVIHVSGCSVKISNNTFNDDADMTHSNSAVGTSGGSSTISNNYFNGGLDVGDSSTVKNNVITGGIGLYGDGAVVSQNRISGGSSYFWIGRDWDRDYNTVVIYGSTTLSGNTIDGTVLVSSNSTSITGNTINGLIQGGGWHLSISNNRISGGINSEGESVTIHHNLIINADTGLKIGNQTVTDNTIAFCKNALVLGGIYDINDVISLTISGNNIVNSSGYSIKLTSTSDVAVSNNWWGTTDQAAISSSIYDKKNDFNLGTVTFTPFLTAFNPNAPGLDYSPTPADTPTATPTATPTLSPTSTPSESPTQQPTSPPNYISVSPVTVVIAVMAVIIVTLLVIVIILSKQLSANRPSKFQNPPASAEASP
jgi:hypothetical protein